MTAAKTANELLAEANEQLKAKIAFRQTSAKTFGGRFDVDMVVDVAKKAVAKIIEYEFAPTLRVKELVKSGYDEENARKLIIANHGLAEIGTIYMVIDNVTKNLNGAEREMAIELARTALRQRYADMKAEALASKKEEAQ